MKQEDFDRQFEEERKEMADLEYADPLDPTLEDEEDMEIVQCSCLIDPEFCEVHNPENDQN